MKTVVVLLAALTLAPVTVHAADVAAGTDSAAPSVRCLLDPALCNVVERSKFRR